MAIDPVSAVQAVTGVVQAGVGVVQSITGNKRLKRLLRQQTAYSTPDEYFDMNNMATYDAQTGYSADTMSYLTAENNRALTTSLGAAARMGGDPNSIAAIFDRNIQGIMKVGADSELIKLQKFSKVYDTVARLAEEQTAVWADKEAKLKDRMEAAGMLVKAGAANMQSGFNAILGGAANAAAGGLYKEQQQDLTNQRNNTRVQARRPTDFVPQIPIQYSTPSVPTQLAPRQAITI